MIRIIFIWILCCVAVDAAAEQKLDMCWQGKESHLHFISSASEVYVEIVFQMPPKWGVEGLLRLEKGAWGFSYLLQANGVEECNNRAPQLDEKYVIAARRIVEGDPQKMTLDELVGVVRDKNILFYTGAGISIAAGIPAMQQLNSMLGLGEGEKFECSLQNVIKHPKNFAHKIRWFRQACLNSVPTRAHEAIKEIARHKKCCIYTENLDCLHEKSGVDPRRVNVKLWQAEDLSKVEYLICIGLSHDDKGFLGWYKQIKPQGRIIAIDLKKPSYLGDEDFLLQGDLQKILPQLEQAVVDAEAA